MVVGVFLLKTLKDYCLGKCNTGWHGHGLSFLLRTFIVLSQFLSKVELQFTKVQLFHRLKSSSYDDNHVIAWNDYHVIAWNDHHAIAWNDYHVEVWVPNSERRIVKNKNKIFWNAKFFVLNHRPLQSRTNLHCTPSPHGFTIDVE